MHARRTFEHFLLLSGYSRDDVDQLLLGTQRVGFLAKPFTLQALRMQLMELLG
ncbi:MAG: hypothetical protein HC822_19965 [Oscillochloris sp.]|nr:hypothetical protein [Oscillochloris sp.]